MAQPRERHDSRRRGTRARCREASPRWLDENYGRGLLELHTLSVDGGYSQADVIAVARALTGWKLMRPREGGAFVFDSSAHDADEKLVQRVARRFLETHGDIRQVMAVIATSPELYRKAAFRAKVKTPYEVVVSTYRAMDGVPDTLGRSVQLAAALGQPLYGHATPEGWPDDAASWMNTGAVLNRINFGSNVAAGRIPGITLARASFYPTLQAARGVAQVEEVGAVLLQGEVTSDTRSVLLSGENPLATHDRAMARPASGRVPSLVELVGLALGSPEFQRR